MKVKVKKIMETKNQKIRVSEKNISEHLKAFTITITDNFTGKEIVKEDTNIVLGVYHDIKESNRENCAMGAISAVHCNNETMFCAAESLSSLQKETLKRLLSNTLSDLLED